MYGTTLQGTARHYTYDTARRHTVLHHTALHHTTLRYPTGSCIRPSYTRLYYTPPPYTVLSYTILYYTAPQILYCTKARTAPSSGAMQSRHTWRYVRRKSNTVAMRIGQARRSKVNVAGHRESQASSEENSNKRTSSSD